MSDRHVRDRRLRLRAALKASVGAFARLCSGAAGSLAAAAILLLSGQVSPDTVRPLIALVATAAVLVTVGALARLSITDSVADARALGLGPFGLQFGKVELRLLGASLLCLLFLAMVVALLGLVVLAIFGMAELDVAAIQARDWAGAGAPWKLFVSIAVGVGAVLVPLMLAGRLSLFVPATVGRRQMVSLTSMSLSAGSGWPLLAGLVITSLPMIGLTLAVGAGLVRGPGASIVGTIVWVGVQLPLTLAFLGAAYRQLDDSPLERP